MMTWELDESRSAGWDRFDADPHDFEDHDEAVVPLTREDEEAVIDFAEEYIREALEFPGHIEAILPY